MIGVFDSPTVAPANPRKHRRLEEKPPDEGSPGARSEGFGIPSYKDSLLHGVSTDPSEDEEILDDEDFELEEGDVTRTVVDGLVAIDFSDRVQELTEKSFAHTVILKLLGR
ncbi:hypothetical protein HRI_002682700 [Hibiscus trionum]|uniref:Uncharacterized protein n=1 Tax=Hibiscus trionum TaxID=183268 RepID=A0A9W7I4A3_HIBTR|nr:hypothetical protein HRI_002682700 [Hibiscus trionum]